MGCTSFKSSSFCCWVHSCKGRQSQQVFGGFPSGSGGPEPPENWPLRAVGNALLGARPYPGVGGERDVT